MAQSHIATGRVFQNGVGICLARLVDEDDNPITQADIDSITAYIYDLSDTSSPASQPSIAVDDVIFDTLQTDWGEDEIGYNFKAAVDGFTSADTTYQVEFWFTVATASLSPAVFQFTTIDTYGS